jgi:hypothetical protein
MFRMAHRSAKRTRINTESLETMGAPALASLLVDHAKVDPILRRKLQLLLANMEGSGKLVTEIEKRLRTIGRSNSHIAWERTKDIVQELDHLRETIAGQPASQDRTAAVERMWDFIGIADDVLERTGDNYGTVEEVFGQAMVDLGRLCADHPGSDPTELARRVLSIVEGDGFRSSAAMIRHLSEALGSRGRAEIRAATKKALAAAPKSEAADRWQVEDRRRHLAHRLALLADIEGDVDEYIAAMRGGGMEAIYAPDIAERLIRAGRPGQAIDWIRRSRRPFDDEDTTHIELMVEALEALGKKNDAQDARWRYFEKTLNVESLRAYLKRLPDFEDFEAERKAFEIAANHRSVDTALEFFVAWPNLQRADEIVRVREKELDGGAYYKMRPAAEALEGKYPAGATRLYRRMVESVLHRGSSKQYPYAARDLQSCIRLAPRVVDDASLEKHATFVARLQQSHGRKHGFWGLVKP